MSQAVSELPVLAYGDVAAVACDSGYLQGEGHHDQRVWVRDGRGCEDNASLITDFHSGLFEVNGQPPIPVDRTCSHISISLSQVTPMLQYGAQREADELPDQVSPELHQQVTGHLTIPHLLVRAHI